MKAQTKKYLKDQKRIDFTGDIKYFFSDYWDGRKTDETLIEELTEYLLGHEGRKGYEDEIKKQAKQIMDTIRKMEKS